MIVKRIGTGVAFVVGGFLLFAVEHRTGTGAFLGVFTLAVVFQALREFYTACRGSGYRPMSAVGQAAGVLFVVAGWVSSRGGGGMAPWSDSLALVLAVALVLGAAVRRELQPNLAADLGVTLFGAVYIGFLYSFGVRLQGLNEIGLEAMAVSAAAIVAGDIAAYAGGLTFGRTKLAPRLSPKKTVEGLVAGMAGGIAAGAAVAALWPGEALPLLGGGGIGILVCVVAPLSDLSESLIKRVLGVKDSGALLPGHGGILDRFDSFLFALPAVYYGILLFRAVGG